MANTDVYALVALPQNLSNYAGKILTIDQIATIDVYNSNITSCEKDVLFDAGEFTGISFYENTSRKTINRFTVFALHKSLKSGPEYHINGFGTDKDHNKKLRNIVMDYLDAHKNSLLHLENFM